jgi:hypothetical protein
VRNQPDCITRTVRAVTAAGQKVKRVEVDYKEGRVIITTGEPTEDDNNCNNQWDIELEKNEVAEVRSRFH